MQQLAELYSVFKRYPKICTDTRNIQEDSIFFALKGESFNGNMFADEALAKGARYAVIDEPQYKKDKRYILVDDVLNTLQSLARHHRNQLNIPVIGITGTNGKTTTKELIHTVLSQKYQTFATQGNLNNHIGVPLTILSITDDIEIAIVEMGANHQQEITQLCSIAQPTHGLITNVGKAHLEGFGGFDGVIAAKGELYDHLASHGGFLFVQGDNLLLRQMLNLRMIEQKMTYGFSAKNDIIGTIDIANPMLHIKWHSTDNNKEQHISTQITGSYNTENILAAICIGLYFDVTSAAINTAIESYVPTNNRSQISKTAYNTVIRDYYNANASSMAAALENLSYLATENKTLILGDMFELGEDTAAEHHKVVELSRKIKAERRIFVGQAFFSIRDKDDEFYQTTEEARQALSENPVRDSLVLVKASRGMAFEKLIDVL